MSHTLKDEIKEMEKEAMLNALEECHWIQARAARKLGITERMIGYKIKKYGIEIKEVNDGEASVSSKDEEDQHRSNN
jgi:Nif-specific regulatory protein